MTNRLDFKSIKRGVWLLRGTGTGSAVDETVGMPIYWPAWKPD